MNLLLVALLAAAPPAPVLESTSPPPLLSSTPPPATLASSLPRVAWLPGPTTLDLGTEAELRIPETLAFAGADDTKKMMQAMGNRVTGQELGLVSPRAAGDDWALVFEYVDAGHVEDDDKDQIDARALLEALRLRAEQDRERRRALGQPPLQVIGWYELPHYDAETHRLIWAPQARTEDGRGVVNYNIRLLGREGFMAVTLIETPGRLPTSKGAALQALEGFSFKPGRAYADYRPGDRLARQGLLALLAGGAVSSARAAIFVGAAVLVLVVLIAAWGRWRSAPRLPAAARSRRRQSRRP